MTKRLACGLVWTALVVMGVRVAAQSPPAPAGTGHWEGAISVQGKEMKITVDLAAKAADAWEGVAAFPEMNAKGLMLSPISVKGEAVTFGIKGAPGEPTFRGTLSKDSKTLSGDFTQGPVVGTFTLAWKGEAVIEAPPRNPPVGKDFEGSWDGTLEVNGVSLRLALKLVNQDGAATGLLISIDQGGAEIPLSAITQNGAHVTFTVPAVGGSYEGDIKDNQITGNWTQGPGTLPLAFKRAAK